MSLAKKVVVAMSGGVDSAVAAYLMKEKGYEVIGVTLKLAPDSPGSNIERTGRCCSVDDMTDARLVCDKLGIPFYAIDAQPKFKEVVFDPFIKAYQNGVTPIPCLACNHEVKFGDLFACAESLGAELATGHYAQVKEYKDNLKTISFPLDMARDQTYYLYGTNPKIVSKLHFPLGGMLKSKAREIAKQIGLVVHDKKDSHEICFVPDKDHGKIIEKVTKKTFGGEIINEKGEKLGEHKGIHNFTIGQRRGLNVSSKQRLFVADLDPKEQKVVLTDKSNLLCENILVSDFRYLVPINFWPKKITLKIRAQGQMLNAQYEYLENKIKFTFDESVFAVALGQACVVYDGDYMLGGGIISARLDGAFPRSCDYSS